MKTNYMFSLFPHRPLCDLKRDWGMGLNASRKRRNHLKLITDVTQSSRRDTEPQTPHDLPRKSRSGQVEKQRGFLSVLCGTFA
jgi:hypothetical protein